MSSEPSAEDCDGEQAMALFELSYPAEYPVNPLGQEAHRMRNFLPPGSDKTAWLILVGLVVCIVIAGVCWKALSALAWE